MSRSLLQFRVFIGSPGGLAVERNAFRSVLERFNKNHGEPNGILFQPIGWEDTLADSGRPQELINQDLRECDYAIFLLHDRWGSSPGPTYSSGTEEEWEIAQQQYSDKAMRSICLFFKNVDNRRLSDPGEQLKKVLEFRKKVSASRTHLFKTYSETGEFESFLEQSLARWLKDNLRKGSLTNPAPSSSDDLSSPATAIDVAKEESSGSNPTFDYWVRESARLTDSTIGRRDPSGALFCANKALEAARTNVELADAHDTRGVAQFFLNNLLDAYRDFSDSTARFAKAADVDRRRGEPLALFNRALTLGALGRPIEEIATYDELIRRYSAEGDWAPRVSVAKALLNKGVRLGALGRRPEAITTYDNLIDKFGNALELEARIVVARALYNKAADRRASGKMLEEIQICDELVGRFGTAREVDIRVEVVTALLSKGVALGLLGRDDEAISTYDFVIRQFSDSDDLRLRTQVARTIVSKGDKLQALERHQEAIEVFDVVLNEYGFAMEADLYAEVASALLGKALSLQNLGRIREAISIYDYFVGRFSTAGELRVKVARALLSKADNLNVLGEKLVAHATNMDIVRRFGTVDDAKVQAVVAEARSRIAKPGSKKQRRLPKRA